MHKKLDPGCDVPCTWLQHDDLSDSAPSMRSLTQLQRETLRHLSAICPLRAGPSSQPKRRFVVACALVCHIRPNGPPI